MNDRTYQKKLRRIEKQNEDRRRRAALRNARIGVSVKKRETSKKLAIYLFVLMNVIVVYAMVAMWQMRDLSYLGVLISDIAAQVLVYAIYCLKAFNGKREEEQIALERQKLGLPVAELDYAVEPVIEPGIEENENDIS